MLTLTEIESRLFQTHATQTRGCMFCEVDRSLIVAETENLWLIRDKFPVIDGHLMVISKDHYGCMGELPAKFFEQIESLRAALPYSKKIAYEHGRAGHCVKLKGSQITCHHFHLHFLPLDVDIRADLEPRFSATPFASLDETPRLYETLGEYLFVELSNGEKFFYPASGRVESHLLRTLVCEAADRSHRSDWETL